MGLDTTGWEEIRKRLEITTAAISGQLARDPVMERRILEERARAAAARQDERVDAETVELLTFSLGQEDYGVETRYVREVLQLTGLTAVPCTPPFIAGVINLHGHILAIVDLREFFALNRSGLTELNRVVVLGDERSELGLLTDSVDGVRVEAMDQLQSNLPTLTGIRERYLLGVTGRMRAVLDGRRLLDDESLVIDEQVNPAKT